MEFHVPLSSLLDHTFGPGEWKWVLTDHTCLPGWNGTKQFSFADFQGSLALAQLS